MLNAEPHFYPLCCTQAVVRFVQAFAQQSDPLNAANKPELGADCEAARVRRFAAFAPLLSLLRGLLDPAKSTEVQKKMSPADRIACKKQVRLEGLAPICCSA